MPRLSSNILLHPLLILLAAFWLAGCSDEVNDPNPKVQKLAKLLGSQISSLSELVYDPLSNDDPKAVQAVLANFFLKCSQTGQALENGVVVLDEHGVTFAERDPAPGHPEGVSVRASARDYSSYRIIRKTLKSGRTEVGVVYLPQDKLYVVCHPVGKTKPVGVLVLGILGSYLETRLGISGQDFLDMQINS